MSIEGIGVAMAVSGGVLLVGIVLVGSFALHWIFGLVMVGIVLVTAGVSIADEFGP